MADSEYRIDSGHYFQLRSASCRGNAAATLRHRICLSATRDGGTSRRYEKVCHVPKIEKEEALVRTPALAPLIRDLSQVRYIPEGSAGKMQHLRPGRSGRVAVSYCKSGRRNI